jgi:hypothetical protein
MYMVHAKHTYMNTRMDKYGIPVVRFIQFVQRTQYVSCEYKWGNYYIKYDLIYIYITKNYKFEIVESFKYLGVILSEDNSHPIETLTKHTLWYKFF